MERVHRRRLAQKRQKKAERSPMLSLLRDVRAQYLSDECIRHIPLMRVVSSPCLFHFRLFNYVVDDDTEASQQSHNLFDGADARLFRIFFSAEGGPDVRSFPFGTDKP